MKTLTQMVRPTATILILLALLGASELPAQTTRWPAPTRSESWPPDYPTTDAPQLPSHTVGITPGSYPMTDASSLGEARGPQNRIPVYQPQYPLAPRATSTSVSQPDRETHQQPASPRYAQQTPTPSRLGANRWDTKGARSTAPGEQRHNGTFGASTFQVQDSVETRSILTDGGSGQPMAAPASDATPDDGSPAPEAQGFAFDEQVLFARPYWEVDVDLVGLRRRKANDYPLITDQAGGGVVLNALDLDFDYKLGFHVDLIHQSAYGWGWEIETLGVPTWDGKHAVAGNLQLNGPGFDVAIDPAAFSVDYRSSLYSVELNARQSDGYRWACYAGFRYMRFSDDLTVSELNAPVLGALDIGTENNLYGLQLGGDLLVYDRGGPLNASIELKVGVYGNDVRQRTRSSLVPPAVAASAKKPLLAGEMEFLLTYKLSPRWKVRGSYKLIGLDSVALAPDQIGATDLGTGRAAIHYNSLLLDGGLLGVECVW